MLNSKRKKERMLAVRQERNKQRREKEKKDKIPAIDPNFIRFKDEIYPEINLQRGSRRNRLMRALDAHGMHIESLPYCLFSEQCNLIPNCRRSYCQYWHNSKERELGQVILKITRERKYDRYIMRRKEFHYYQNVELMDYDFNVQYVQDKMSRKRENNSRKYSVKRQTSKRDKKRAYILRKKDKRGNAKQNRKFKGKYGADLVDARDYCRTYQKEW